MKKFYLAGSAVLLCLVSGCGGDDTSSSSTFSGALGTVSSTLEEMSQLSPVSTSLMSANDFRLMSALGGDWTSGTVRLPDQSGTSLSIKEYMGKQLDPNAVGDGGGGQSFALNVFGRFNNAMMIGCALMTVGANIDATTGYPANGTMAITMSAANLATMVSKCGMSQAESNQMAAASPTPEISAVVESATNTTYYDKKITMTLPASMGGATQYFYFRFNSSEINIFNAEDGSSFDSRTLVNMDLSTNVLKVEYYSGGSGGGAALYFHRLYYDKGNDIGKLTTYYGSSTDFVKYTLAGKPNTGGTFALSFTSDQTANYSGQACVSVSTGVISTDDSLACTLTGTAVASATVLSDALSRLGDSDWVTPSETKANTFTVDNVFAAVAP